jgi:hypothetical protein
MQMQLDSFSRGLDSVCFIIPEHLIRNLLKQVLDLARNTQFQHDVIGLITVCDDSVRMIQINRGTERLCFL